MLFYPGFNASPSSASVGSSPRRRLWPARRALFDEKQQLYGQHRRFTRQRGKNIFFKKDCRPSLGPHEMAEVVMAALLMFGCALIMVFVPQWFIMSQANPAVTPKQFPSDRFKHRHLADNRNDNDNFYASLSPLEDIDYEQYTLRINTWKRPETLRASLAYHSTCPGVAEIQVVWCTDQGQVPQWLLELSAGHGSKIIVEEHEVNSLNERFHVLSTPATRGVLSIDDDVLRPCLAYDWAFAKWTRNPDRLVTFDARSHTIVESDLASENDAMEWQYQQLTVTETANRYSFGLTRCAFLHVDYLYWYTSSSALSPLRDFVNENFNCEDIAMSLLISSQTGGRPPLLPDFWAVKCTIELDDGQHKISNSKDHRVLRNQCLNDFAEYLNVKENGDQPLQFAAMRSYFDYGDEAEDWNDSRSIGSTGYMSQVHQRVNRWKDEPTKLKDDLMALRLEAARFVYSSGLVEGSKPWKKRFGGDDAADLI